MRVLARVLAGLEKRKNIFLKNQIRAWATSEAPTFTRHAKTD